MTEDQTQAAWPQKEETMNDTTTEIMPVSHASIATVEEIDVQLRRAEKMGEALDKLRGMAVKRTVPSDWVAMGETLYLEGDGGLRIAPMIGLQLSRLETDVEHVEGGLVMVTCRADAASALFGTRLPGIERTRTNKDDFLRRGRDFADIEDVKAAAYKGMIARACQLLLGISGLTPEEAATRFGLDVSKIKGVTYKGGMSEAKRTDAANASGDIAEINKLLIEVFEGNAKAAADWLEKMTENTEKGWPGKRDAAKLTEKGAAYVVKKLRDMARMSERTPGAEG